MNQHVHDLGDFVSNHPKGKALLPVLNEVVAELESQKGSLLSELGSLGQGIDHIADLVRSQQSYAGTKGVFELAKLDRQVEAALKILQQAYGTEDGVRIVREFEELPQVHVDKHKLMEILVNVLQNARQALAEVERPDKRITVRIARAGQLARIEVEDNGPGITAENLSRIFNHGFTTKKDGHGFGLHVSANAATEMGASLTARSDGPGQGATFVLAIPIQSAKEQGGEAARAA
jgi:C4-dicarboxylate-specific signal transduction histidine kinase